MKEKLRGVYLAFLVWPVVIVSAYVGCRIGDRADKFSEKIIKFSEKIETLITEIKK